MTNKFLQLIHFFIFTHKIKNMKSKILIVAAVLISSFSVAQTKVGTINSDYIINIIMPTEKKDIIHKIEQKKIINKIF